MMKSTKKCPLFSTISLATDGDEVAIENNREIVNSFRKRVITMRKGVIVSDEEEGGYLED